MAMSVAENAPITTEPTPRSLQQQLAVGSFLGALYVLGGLWIVLAGLPVVWDLLFDVPEGYPPIMNPFLSATLLMMLCAVVAAGVGYGGYLLLRNHNQHGLRAGIFFASVMLFLSAWISEASGNVAAQRGEPSFGIVAAVVLLILLAGGTVFLFLQPGWGRLLENVEDQGWFHARAFKGSQGARVRRGTVIGVLTLGVCGIITLWTHRSFGYETPDSDPNDWFWYIPGTEDAYALPLMFKVHLIMPVLLLLALIAFAWRLVNVPVFADFLIATEAEMNKVSWTTRRRLIQDTIVVLVTVFLLTVFLFLVDIMWIAVLGWGPIGVLQYDPRSQQKQQQEKNQW
jgi:preprotein translocase SecE subunit